MKRPVLQHRTAARPARKSPEAELQKAMVDFLQIAAPHLLIAAIPNGGASKAANGRNKAMGARAGMPDFLVMDQDGAVVWFEVKAPGGVVSAVQKEIHRELRVRGHTVWVIYSLEDLQRALHDSGIRTRVIR
jgi:hypothetical protein